MNEQVVAKSFEYFGAWGVSMAILCVAIFYLIRRLSEERVIQEKKRVAHESLIKDIVERHEERMVALTNQYDSTMKQSINVISKAAQIMTDFRSND